MINNHEQKHQRLDKYLVVAGPWAQRPGNLFDGLLYKDTDRGGLEFSYNAAAGQWLSTQLYQLPLTFNPTGTVTTPLAATTPVALISGGPEDVSKLYVVKAVIRGVTNTTLDATNNWTFELFRQNSAGTNVSLGTINTFQTGRTAGTSYLNTITVNTALSAVTDGYVFFITATKNAAPGTLTFSPGVMWFRLIG